MHEASCILDVLTMMYQQAPDTSQLGALLDFRDVIQTISDSPWDRYPQKMSLAKDVRRKERIPPNSFVWIPHHLRHEAKHILRELEDVKTSRDAFGGRLGTKLREFFSPPLRQARSPSALRSRRWKTQLKASRIKSKLAASASCFLFLLSGRVFQLFRLDTRQPTKQAATLRRKQAFVSRHGFPKGYKGKSPLSENLVKKIR